MTAEPDPRPNMSPAEQGLRRKRLSIREKVADKGWIRQAEFVLGVVLTR